VASFVPSEGPEQSGAFTSEEIMSTQSRIFQRIGGLGIVYSLLCVGAFILFGSDPSTGASGASVIKYYHSHRASVTAAVFVIAVAAVVLTFFLSSLRRTLSRTDEGRLLASIVTAGGAVYISGLLLMDALNIALIDSAHYGMSTTAQTLNVLSNDAWVPVVVGISILTLGTGVAALRTRALPRWLAWASVVLGIMAVSGPLGAIAFLGVPLWTLATGIVLLRSSEPEEIAESVPTVASALISSNV
jgi:hypothetical protein